MDGDSGEATAVAVEAHRHDEDVDGGGDDGSGFNSAEEDKGFKDIIMNEDGEKNFGGNRWPRHETLALLKIRSDMDAVFRDSTHKAPLWDEVSRKLGDLGYNRNAKKCKEKFENVYKYHKRTKEVRIGKSDNCKKNYKFSDELEALNHHHQISFQSPVPQSKTLAFDSPWNNISSTVPSPINPTKASQNIHSSPPSKSLLQLPPKSNLPNMSSANVVFSSSTSSSTASDEDPPPPTRGKKRKRKWTDFFVKLTKEVIEKQEGLQVKFLEALERIENQRKLRDEAWRIKQVSRVNQEHEILVQEMSLAAAKDEAVVSFLQKLTPPSKTTSPPPPPSPLPLPPRQLPPPPPQTISKTGNSENGIITTLAMMSSSRWPKSEVEDLIRLRTEMELKYQDNGAKGSLWEEISLAMGKLGHIRNAKRCKEKWENINKYFKKVKDSNKKRPQDSKTCPYFHQLDALYKEKSGKNSFQFDINSQMEPLMVEPEQQWPPPLHGNHIIMGNIQRINGDQEDDDESNSNTDLEEEEEEEAKDGGRRRSFDQLVTNKQSPISISNTV